MRKNIATVISAFLAKKPAAQATCSTDGEIVLSYSLKIAERLPNGRFRVAPLRSSTRTTNTQISALHQALAGQIEA